MATRPTYTEWLGIDSLKNSEETLAFAAQINSNKEQRHYFLALAQGLRLTLIGEDKALLDELIAALKAPDVPPGGGSDDAVT